MIFVHVMGAIPSVVKGLKKLENDSPIYEIAPKQYCICAPADSRAIYYIP